MAQRHNQRIFYAVQAVAICSQGKEDLLATDIVKGLQSVGMSSSFTLDQVFEMGQVAIYENIEEVADIEVTLEKVIDGYKLIYDLATNGLCKTSLVSASKERTDVYLAVFDDGQDNATGLPQTVCMNSGMYVSSVAYSYSIDGSATESVTMVGNDRFWNSTHGVTDKSPVDIWGPAGELLDTGFNIDTPKSGVVRRVNVDMANSALPEEVTLQRGNDPVNLSGGNHIQSVSVSTDFGQENIQELGRFGPYHRYATFPIEVTSEFEVIATSGDLVSVSGIAPNLQNRTIRIEDTAGTVLTLGDKNKLSSVSYSGADTGGGNATVSYSFSNFNVLTVDGGST